MNFFVVSYIGACNMIMGVGTVGALVPPINYLQLYSPPKSGRPSVANDFVH